MPMKSWTRRRRVLNPEDIRRARYLKRIGHTNREIASDLQVPKTTIWDNIYFDTRKPRPRREIKPAFRDIRSVILVTTYMKKTLGLNSGEVAHSLQIPLVEINYIYARN